MNYKIEDLLEELKKVDSMIEIHSDSNSIMLDQYKSVKSNIVSELASELVMEYPNNSELGSKWRSICIKFVELDGFCLKFPNDYYLGKFLRKNFNKYLVN
jgi:transposase